MISSHFYPKTKGAEIAKAGFVTQSIGHLSLSLCFHLGKKYKYDTFIEAVGHY